MHNETLNVWSHLVGFLIFATFATCSVSFMMDNVEEDVGRAERTTTAVKDRLYLLCYEVVGSFIDVMFF